MVKPVHVLGFGVAGLILYNLFSRKTAAGTLNFYPAAMKDIRFEGATPVITIGLAVQNTSNQSFGINSLAGTLYDTNNGQRYVIGTAQNFTRQVIHPNSAPTIWLDFRLSLIGVVVDLISDITYGQLHQDLEFKGYANVDGLQVPLNFNYKL